MAPRGRGTILVTGATASRARRRRAIPPSPAPSTRCGRSPQSAARELGPKGIHVAHVVIDGMIDGVFARTIAPDAAERLAREEILDPDEIARNYVHLTASAAAPGPSRWTCGPVLRELGEAWRKRSSSCSISPARIAGSPIARCRRCWRARGAAARDRAGAARRDIQGDGQPVADRRLRPRQGQARLREPGDPALHRPPRPDAASA